MTFGFLRSALLAAAFIAAPALAGQQDFTIVNNTGHVVVTLNVSPSRETRWGPDILGREVLANGEQAQVTFDRDESICLWDIRVTYDDGDTGDWRQVNLCETSEITLRNE